MNVIHALKIKSKCPVDGTEDVYRCTISVARVLPVEEILRWVEELTAEPIFQEALTRSLSELLHATVETKGVHSGVETTCRCG